MKNRFILSIIFIFLFITTAFAVISIKAEVDKTSLSTDEILSYKITITSSDKKVPAPQIPKFNGFNVLSSAQSSTISFVEGKTKTILVHAFILTPTNIGKFKIEPSTIKIENKIYSTDGFEIEVTQSKKEPSTPSEKKIQPRTQPDTIPQTEEDQEKITL